MRRRRRRRGHWGGVGKRRQRDRERIGDEIGTERLQEVGKQKKKGHKIGRWRGGRRAREERRDGVMLGGRQK